jgi:RNA polymerase sigma-70 factor (ECF subfamily)
MTPPAAEHDFQPHYRHLRALAYRMLGSRSEAEDAVQDTWLRWQSASRADVDNPRAYLSRTITHLCLDRLQSARARREQYVGTWLPEPLVDEDLHPGADVDTEYAQEVSTAFLLALERLSPLERAAFLLHDVFDLDFGEVALRLQRSPAAVRQLASRARVQVRREHVRRELQADEGERLLQAFGQAIAGGDLEALTRLLADDAVFLSDGGGVVSAVPRPLQGAGRIAKALIGFWHKQHDPTTRAKPARINGRPGWVLLAADGTPVQTVELEPGADGRVAAVHIVRNPDKLAHLRIDPAPAG